MCQSGGENCPSKKCNGSIDRSDIYTQVVRTGFRFKPGGLEAIPCIFCFFCCAGQVWPIHSWAD